MMFRPIERYPSSCGPIGIHACFGLGLQVREVDTGLGFAHEGAIASRPWKPEPPVCTGRGLQRCAAEADAVNVRQRGFAHGRVFVWNAQVRSAGCGLASDKVSSDAEGLGT